MSKAWRMPALHQGACPQIYGGSIYRERVPLLLVGIFLLLCWIGPASAHDVSGADCTLISSNPGLNVILYGWLGAKHMITGYDHLLHMNKSTVVFLIVAALGLGALIGFNSVESPSRGYPHAADTTQHQTPTRTSAPVVRFISPGDRPAGGRSCRVQGHHGAR